MFCAGDTVICVDDKFPNPNCTFPNGVVIQGQRYHVSGVSFRGGVFIVGLPVFPAVEGITMFPFLEVGWKPHRFRKVVDDCSTDSVEREEELELVGV